MPGEGEKSTICRRRLSESAAPVFLGVPVTTSTNKYHRRRPATASTISVGMFPLPSVASHRLHHQRRNVSSAERGQPPPPPSASECFLCRAPGSRRDDARCHRVLLMDWGRRDPGDSTGQQPRSLLTSQMSVTDFRRKSPRRLSPSDGV